MTRTAASVAIAHGVWTRTAILILFAAFPLLAPAADITPDDALKQLQAGNQRFVDGTVQNPRADAARREETAKGQQPFASILGCSDSRVPLERVFDQGLGDIFAVRVAGNVAGTDEIGSLEYAAGHLHTPLIVVLGHTKCGAVGAAIENPQVPGSVNAIVQQIRPAVARAKQQTPGVEGVALSISVVRENVWQSIQALLTKSPELHELAAAGKLKIVGAVYDLQSGKIDWLGPHPDEAKLLKSAEHKPGAENKPTQGSAEAKPAAKPAAPEKPAPEPKKEH